MFLFCLLQAHYLCVSDSPPFYSWNPCWLHILYCSDYLHIFPLDPVTIAVWLVSFHLIILNIPRQTTAYASSIRNNPHSFCWNLDILCNSFPTSINIREPLKFSKAANLFEISTWHRSLPSTSFNYWDWTSPCVICALFVYSLPVSL
jgi:hypothetical protein